MSQSAPDANSLVNHVLHAEEHLRGLATVLEELVDCKNNSLLPGEEPYTHYYSPLAYVNERTNGSVSDFIGNLAKMETMLHFLPMIEQGKRVTPVTKLVDATNILITDYRKIRRAIREMKPEVDRISSSHAEDFHADDFRGLHDDNTNSILHTPDFSGQYRDLQEKFSAGGTVRDPMIELMQEVRHIAKIAGVPTKRLDAIAAKLEERQRGFE